MLLHLTIQNYALIDKIEISFNKGFSTITGETGAGKSILINALSLITGQRADLSLLKNKEKKCIVEAEFIISEYNLQGFFHTHNLDYSDILIVRREITPAGASRAFINDTPASITQIRELGLKLIDIHSQHENLLLANGKFQLAVLDSLASNNKLLDEYKSNYGKYNNLLVEYRELAELAGKSKSETDYHTFQLNKLDEACLKENEDKELEREKEILENSEQILDSLTKIANTLTEDEKNIVTELHNVISITGNLRSMFPEAESWQKRLESCNIELKDIAGEITTRLNKIETSPAVLQNVLERLDLIYSLLHKHKAENAGALIQIREELRDKISSVEKIDEELSALGKEVETHKAGLEKISAELSKHRKTAAAGLVKNIIPQLKELGINNAAFDVVFSELPDFSPSGRDSVKFLFSANKKIEPRDISAVASGGELSRLMLSIKSFIAGLRSMPTIIFDEIDAGVSGETAYRMSSIMQKMSEKTQIISITHLPQIASRGQNHYLVFKDSSGETSTTRIRLLGKEERISEIARMLSGKEISRAAFDNARALLDN